MKGLCDRYNRAIDSIVQLVSEQLNLYPVIVGDTNTLDNPDVGYSRSKYETFS
jgi:hypothetical protein